MTQHEQANIDTVRRFYREAFSANRLDLLPEPLAEDVQQQREARAAQ